MRGGGAAVACLIGAAVAAAPASAAKLERVTRGADGHSYRPSLSHDGRLVAFESNADSLSRDDDDRVRNVYVRDMGSGRVTLVSRASGPGGAGGDGASSQASISADGRFVAFQSRARNLGLPPSGDAVFVRDLRLGITRAIGQGVTPSISADGRYVAYVAEHPEGPNAQVFRHDAIDGSTVIVSRAGGADGALGDESSFVPSISADGSRVAFESFAENLDRFADEGELHKVFVRDIPAATTERVSRGSGPEGRPGEGASLDPSISGDGRFVAFWSTSDETFIEGGNLFHPYHAWIRDLTADRLSMVDRARGARGAPGNADAGKVELSHDGRFAVFESASSNLASGSGAKGRVRVFVRDLRDHRAVRVGPAAGDRRLGLEPEISGSGRYVAFEWRGSDRIWHVMRARR